MIYVLDTKNIYLSGRYASKFCESLKEYQVPSKNNNLIACYQNRNTRIDFYQNFRIYVSGPESKSIEEDITEKVNNHLSSLYLSLPENELLKIVGFEREDKGQLYTHMLEMELACRLAKYNSDLTDIFLEFISNIAYYPQNLQDRLKELLFICYSFNIEEACQIIEIIRNRNTSNLRGKNIDELMKSILQERYEKVLKESDRIHSGITSAYNRQRKLNEDYYGI